MTVRAARVVLALTLAAVPACAGGSDQVEVHLLPPEPAGQRSPGVYVTWLGTAGVVVDDGETRLAIDPFVTRDSLLHVLLGRPVESSADEVDRWLGRSGGMSLDAVFVTHSHYDHSLDAPTVARRTGAVLVGSPDTLTQARAQRLGSGQQVPARVGEPMRFGRFTVTLRRSSHGEPEHFPGRIEGELRQPARARDYRTGEVYSVLVEHPLGTLLHHASASRRPETYDESTRADVVLLGVAGRYELEEYLHQVVDAVGATRVIPMHYDHFFRPLDRPLRPLPGLDLLGLFETLASRRPDLRVQTLPLGEPRRVLAAEEGAPGAVAGIVGGPAPCSAP